QRLVLWASLVHPAHLVPGSCLPRRSAGALLGSGWRRQDVLGREAPCTLTTETVRGDRLAAHRAPHRYDRVSGPRPLVRTRSSPGGRRPPARPLLVIGRRSRGDLSADMVLNYELHWTPVPPLTHPCHGAYSIVGIRWLSRLGRRAVKPEQRHGSNHRPTST